MNYLKNKFFYKIKLIYYDRIDVLEEIDVNKAIKIMRYHSLLVFFKEGV